jgi:hypothetical protein
VYRYILELEDESGQTQNFGMHSHVTHELAEPVGFSSQEAHSLQSHLDQIAKLVQSRIRSR